MGIARFYLEVIVTEQSCWTRLKTFMKFKNRYDHIIHMISYYLNITDI